MTDVLHRSLRIGSTEAANAFMGAPINIRPYSRNDGYVTEKLLDFYEEYAVSGLGLLVSGACNVSAECAGYTPSLGLWADDQIAGVSKIAAIMKKNGAIALLQIAHRGFQPLGRKTFNDVPIAERLRVKEDFVRAAERAKTAGFDGVELHACHGFFLNQVVSPYTNGDDWLYGGDTERRAKYITDLIAQIRACCGSDFLIDVRMGHGDPDLATSIDLAKRYEAAGTNLLSVSAGIGARMSFGSYEDNGSLGVDLPADFQFCERVYAAWKIREAVKIPVACVGELLWREDVENILVKGYADLVAIGRARLADPQWYAHMCAGDQAQHCRFCKTCAWFTNPEKCPGRKLAGVSLP